MERIRWPEGAECPHCGVVDEAERLNGEAHRDGLWKCYACRKQFSVTVGTVMHRSKIPLDKWVMAFVMLTSSKKGVSALQLQRNLGLGSYRTAWHMAHRIRLAMREEPMAGMLKGTVEVDETYVGGKPRHRQRAPEEYTAATGKEYKRGPLTPDEALRGFMKVNPERVKEAEKRKKRGRKRRRRKNPEQSGKNRN